MLEQNTLDLLTEYSDRTDVVIFYCEEIFQYIDLEDKSFETDNGTTYLKDAEANDFTVYSAEELEMEDDIFEFIKDYKKALKSINEIGNTPNKLTLFMANEDFLTTAEALDEYKSLQQLADYGSSLSLWLLTKDAKLNKSIAWLNVNTNS